MKYKERWMLRRSERVRQYELQLMWNAFNKAVNSKTAKRISESNNLKEDLEIINNIFVQNCRTHNIEMYKILKSKPYSVLKNLISTGNYEKIGLISRQVRMCGNKYKED